MKILAIFLGSKALGTGTPHDRGNKIVPKDRQTEIVSWTQLKVLLWSIKKRLSF